MEARDNPLVKVLRWLAIGFAAVLVLELLLLLWIALSGVQSSESSTDALGDSGLQIDGLSGLEDFSQAVERNLFSWKRRPTGAKEETAANDGNELASKWQLTGLVNTGESTYAIFSQVEGERQIRIEQGMELESWTAEAVDTEQITLVSGDKREVYRLSVNDSPPLASKSAERKISEPGVEAMESSVESKEPE